jgi:hypothetical protein
MAARHVVTTVTFRIEEQALCSGVKDADNEQQL